MNYSLSTESSQKNQLTVIDKKPVEINRFEATLHMKNNAVPKFCKAITVPFALKEVIKKLF